MTGVQTCALPICLETKIIRHKGPMGVGEAVASVDGKVVAQAELTFMVGAAQ